MKLKEMFVKKLKFHVDVDVKKPVVFTGYRWVKNLFYYVKPSDKGELVIWASRQNNIRKKFKKIVK